VTAAAGAMKPDDPRAGVLKTGADETTKACAKLVEVFGGAARQALIAGSSPQGVVFDGASIKDEAVRAAVDAIEKGRPDDEVANAVRRVSPAKWQDAFTVSQGNSAALDLATGPANKAIESVRGLVGTVLIQCRAATRAAREVGAQTAAEKGGELQKEIEGYATDLAAARLRFGARRYDLEAPLNKELALLTEVRVRQANLEAEHHRQRSRLFFYGMLVAQAAVIGATMALAVRQKNILWGLAAVAGLGAIGFGIYVRLYM
jgi:hypothetical protein